MNIIRKIINYYDKEYPKRLLKIKNYPPILYSIGNIELLNSDKIVAIVGSRKCSDYGRRYAKIFARELSEKGICIISGLAVGIDAAAHNGAVNKIGKTIAVIPGGLNKIYPKENIKLFNEILRNNGCIITEHKDDEETIMKDFIKRNRIISGIADATIVVECKTKSGTTSTARYTMQQNKKVYCIPHSLDSSIGIGINELIIKGAMPVMTPKQIINDLYNNDRNKISYNDIKSAYENYNIDSIIKNKKTNENTEKIDIENIPKEYRTIYIEMLNKELTCDELSRRLNIDISDLNYKLTMMEIEEYIIKKSGNKFAINKEKNVS